MTIRPHTMTRFLNQASKVAFVGLAFGTLAACTNVPLEDWSSIPKPREAQAHKVLYAHDVAFKAGQSRLSRVERDRLNTFLSRSLTGTSGTVHLVGATDTVLNQSRRDLIGAYLSRLGVTYTPVGSNFGIEKPGADAVKVVIDRYVVTLPGCPDWSRRPQTTYNNTTSTNFGCATATNLGMMVADPADLVGGRDPGYASGVTGAAAVNRYRRGETKPLTTESTGVEASQGTAQSTTSGTGGS